MSARKSFKNTMELYGSLWETQDPVRVEYECIRLGGTWKSSTGEPRGMGLPYHIIQFSRYVWPWFKWHRWATDLILPELCRPHHRVAIYGPSNSGKSSLTALVYLVRYFAHPENTLVLVSSTTRDELDLRIWGEMKMFFAEAKDQHDWLPGYMTNSKQMISTDGKDSEFGRDVRKGVVGRPCRVGNKWLIGSGMSPFVGIKADNIFLAFDEAGLMPPDSLKVLVNLTANPSCCSAILGNLGDLETPVGQAAEPEHGWDSLMDSDKSRVYPTRWYGGSAVQLIGADSPNLDYPEGSEPYDPPLIGRRYLKQCAQDYGLDTPLYNMFAAGKIPRGTMENRVITKQVCERHGAFEPIIWGHRPLKKLYAMDLSYTTEHGDRTVGRPFAFGPDNEGQMRMAPLEDQLIYTPNDRAMGSIEEQLAAQCMAECKRLDIEPSHVFFDGTGRSSFTAALMRLWSVEVVSVEFGGSATARPNFIGRKYHEDMDYRRKKGDLLPCSEVFGKMVTELWFAFRALVEADQCRGLDDATVKELSMRLWNLTMRNKIDVEPKKEMKLRIGRSPDLADMICVAVEGARRLGFPLGQLNTPTKRNTQWLSRLNRDYEEARSSSELVAA